MSFLKVDKHVRSGVTTLLFLRENLSRRNRDSLDGALRELAMAIDELSHCAVCCNPISQRETCIDTGHGRVCAGCSLAAELELMPVLERAHQEATNAN